MNRFLLLLTPFDDSIVSQHAGVAASVFPRDKGMLHNFIDDIKNMKSFIRSSLLGLWSMLIENKGERLSED